MKKSSGKRYSNDFKKCIVRLYLDGHQSMTALSREYGVTTSTISKWVQTLQNAFHEISDINFDPFLTLSFMALPVIPSLKLTDQGLFDFEKFTFIDLVE